MTSALSLSTRRVETVGVDIEDDGVTTRYPFASAGRVPADDLDHVLAVAQWFAEGVKLLQSGSTEVPAHVPPSIVEMEAAIVKAAQICLPDAPERIIRGVGRDGMVQIVVAFLAHSRGHSFPPPPRGSGKVTRAGRKR